MGRLGLIAGGGALPLRIAARCEADGRPAFVARLRGFAGPEMERFDGVEVGLAEFGHCIEALRGAGCDRVCFAGTASRPDFSSLMPDWKGVQVLPGIIKAARRGDDAMLRQVLQVFENAGFAVVGADEVLGGETLARGALGRHAPREADRADLRKALTVAEAIGALDVGQGAVVAAGLVLAVEAQEGTDAMLRRVAGLPQTLRGRDGARLGVLAKAPKPIQERRVDLPVIGVRTVELAAEAGLAGVAGKAGDLIVIDGAGVVEAADRLGLFVWGEG